MRLHLDCFGLSLEFWASRRIPIREDRICAAALALSAPLPDGVPGDGETDSIERTHRILRELVRETG